MNEGTQGVGRKSAATPVSARTTVRPLLFVLFLALYTLAASAGLQWATVAGAASPIWPAAGVALAGVLLLGRNYAPAIAIGLVLAAQLSGATHPLWSQIAMGIGNALGALAGAWIVGQLACRQFARLSSLQDILVLLVAAGVAASISAIVGTGALWVDRLIDTNRALSVFATWLFGDLVGILTVTSLVLTWSHSARLPWSALRIAHLVVILATTAILSAEIFFGENKARAWMIYPVLAWAAIAMRVQGAAAAVLIASIAAVFGTAYGHGPFAPGGIGGKDLMLLQQFMAVTTVTVLLLGAAVDERDSETELRESLERVQDAERLRARADEELLRTQSILQMIGKSAAALIFAKDRDGRYLYLNEQVAAVMGRPAAAMLGQSDLAWCDPDQARVFMENDRRIMDGGVAEEIDEPVVQADGSVRLYRSVKGPLRDAKGTVIGLVGVGYDVTDRRAAEEGIRVRTVELETLLSSAPIGLAYFDRQYRYRRINDELARINGIPAADHIGKTIAELLPENAKVVEPLLDRVFASGEPIREFEVAGSTPQQPGVARHWLTGYFPVFASTGEVDAVGAWVVEITERKAAEEREHLLSREVDHRAKNLLAVVQSIVQLTPGDDGPTLKASLIGRIQALARAHSLLSDARWNGVDLRELVAEELAPFAPVSSSAVACDGPNVTLRPAAAQSLGLVLHELATNAAKYGALSAKDGHLAVSWHYDEDDKGRFVCLEWTEAGGPPAAAPTRTGFGSNIIRASVERQLRGKVTREWRPEGLHCLLRIPVAEVIGGADV